jgi:hypothetical protein
VRGSLGDTEGDAERTHPLLHKTLSLVTSTQAVGGQRVVGFSILGPLEVTVDGVRVEIPGAKERALLAFLLANAGDTIAVDRVR